MRVFISTGEISGDLQGALLVTALRQEAARRGAPLEILALGGPKMAAAGAHLLADTSAIGAVGLGEALPFLLPTLWVQRRARAALQQQPPQVAVLIDYVGPNVGVGNFLRSHLPQVPTAYYIAPQEWVWAFGARNTQHIVGFSDRILSIFPQEAHYYRQRGARVEWVGHPLLDRPTPNRAQARACLGMAPEELAIALLPASRRQELYHLLPTIAAAAAQVQAARPEVRFWLPLVDESHRGAIAAQIARWGLRATLVGPGPLGDEQLNASLTCLAAADLALAKSGTVNLETALLGVPQVVAYRVSRLTAWIARHVLKFSVPFISPVNLVEMRAIVPELLQDAATPEAIAQAALELLEPDRRAQMQADYQQMRQALGDGGAIERAARAIWQLGLAGRDPDGS